MFRNASVHFGTVGVAPCIKSNLVCKLPSQAASDGFLKYEDRVLHRVLSCMYLSCTLVILQDTFSKYGQSTCRLFSSFRPCPFTIDDHSIGTVKSRYLYLPNVILVSVTNLTQKKFLFHPLASATFKKRACRMQQRLRTRPQFLAWLEWRFSLCLNLIKEVS